MVTGEVPQSAVLADVRFQLRAMLMSRHDSRSLSLFLGIETKFLGTRQGRFIDIHIIYDISEPISRGAK
jgi:hypothetical protein